MKMKRYLAMLLAAAMTAFCLAGCGQGGTQQSKESSKEESSAPSSSSQESSAQPSEEQAKNKLGIDEPVTLTVLCTRHSTATNDASDIWFFHYLEWWLGEQGYDVTIEAQQAIGDELTQQISLMLGTDSLPDILWNTGLTGYQTVTYAENEGMLLDFAPYINEESMPNFYREVSKDADALAVSTLNGHVWGLPYLSSRSYGTPGLSFGMADRMYINQTWLDQCNLEMPTNLDEFLDMLRTFKKEIKLEDGEEVIPLLSNGSANYLEKWLWLSLGYYGNGLEKYGFDMNIKDGKAGMPAYNAEDYRVFVETMKTLYDEGLISKDFFTMDTTTMRGLSQAGVCGAVCDYTLGYVKDFTEWVEMTPFPIGDNDQIAISLDSTYSINNLMVSSKCKYPELAVLICDYMYSPEGAMMYTYGPQEGQDPLGQLDGWTWDGVAPYPTTKLLEDGTFENYETYARQYIRASDNIGKPALAKPKMLELIGKEGNEEAYSITDAITGETIEGVKKTLYTDDNPDGHWRLVSVAAVEPFLTTIRTPVAFLSEEDAATVADLQVVLRDHITAETAKFITGTRPLSELDAFHEELKTMGAEDWQGFYQEAYKDYMAERF